MPQLCCDTYNLDCPKIQKLWLYDKKHQIAQNTWFSAYEFQKLDEQKKEEQIKGC